MVVPFPFTDRQATKVRPAVVVSAPVLSQRNDKYILAMVTSAVNSPHYGDVPVSDQATAGLPVASVVRPSKLAVVETADVVRRIGSLGRAERVQVIRQLGEYLAKVA